MGWGEIKWGEGIPSHCLALSTSRKRKTVVVLFIQEWDDTVKTLRNDVLLNISAYWPVRHINQSLFPPTQPMFRLAVVCTQLFYCTALYSTAKALLLYSKCNGSQTQVVSK